MFIKRTEALRKGRPYNIRYLSTSVHFVYVLQTEMDGGQQNKHSALSHFLKLGFIFPSMFFLNFILICLKTRRDTDNKKGQIDTLNKN